MKLVRSHMLPENGYYPDTGCEQSASCLECPLAMCKYDDPAWLPAHDRAERDRKVAALHKKGTPFKEKEAKEIAKAFKISSRTVYRIIQQGGPSERDLNHADTPAKLSLDKLARKSPIKPRKPWPQLMRRVS